MMTPAPQRIVWCYGEWQRHFDSVPNVEFIEVKHGNLHLEVRYGTALTTTINKTVYAEFDNLLEITATKNIIFDYAA